MTILIVCFYFSEANRQNAPTNKPLPEPAQVTVTPAASRSDLSQGNIKSPKSFFYGSITRFRNFYWIYYPERVKRERIN